MVVRVNQSKCDGCHRSKEPMCIYICPGDLFYQGQDGVVGLREEKDCWDCAACVKSCPKEALELYQPVQMGGNGAILTARTKGKEIFWQCQWANGKKENFKIQVKN